MWKIKIESFRLSGYVEFQWTIAFK
jgi:hypothetical protein